MVIKSCTFAICVQERALSENIKNGAIWHIWRTYGALKAFLNNDLFGVFWNEFLL